MITTSGGSKTTSSPIRALLVDDDLTNRLVLKAMLERQGFDIVMAVNGCDAVAKFVISRPDIVFMDLMMPEMDGNEATRRIKEAAGDRFVPVIFLTATADEGSLAACVEAGGDDFLNKPYSHTLLKAKIDAQLRIMNLHKSLQEKAERLSYHETLHQEELRVAERIVNRISRVQHLDLPNVRYVLKPMGTMNGDLILSAPRPRGGQLFLIGDFTGHGLSAAIGGVTVYDVFYAMASKGFSIKDIVAEMNRKIRQVLPTGRFLSTAMIELAYDFRTVSIWNAGIPDIYVRGEKTGIEAVFPATHVPLGVLSNDELDVQLTTMKMAPKTRIYAYSDGVLEAQNAANDMFGRDRLEACFHDTVNPEALFDTIMQRSEAFRGEMAQSDDFTLLEILCDGTGIGSDNATHASKAQRKPPMDWSMTLELGATALRNTDPLPLVLQMLMDLQGLEEHREKLYLILAELYSNALEHGVLGLNSDLKRSVDGFAEYYKARASALNALQDGSITIDCRHVPGPERNLLLLKLTNTGHGFDVQTLMSRLEQSEAHSRRGIGLVRSICQDVRFDQHGTQVEAVYPWEYTGPPPKLPLVIPSKSDPC